MLPGKKILLIILLMLGTGIYWMYNEQPIAKEINRKVVHKFETRKLNRTFSNCPKCAKTFNDDVETHNLAYNREGIKPQIDFDALDKLHQKKVLVKLENNHLYTIKELEHSRPYLLPKAALFLEDFAKIYENKCRQKSLKYIPFEITSLTRSESSVKSLMIRNRNSIKESGHLKGKTFDINYSDFGGYRKQQELFLETLKELRNKRKCYIKYEKNGCLHITVI
jgi:uncharacterized protein YxeA